MTLRTFDRDEARQGRPLCLRTRDQNPGDNARDGFNKVWHAAKP